MYPADDPFIIQGITASAVAAGLKKEEDMLDLAFGLTHTSRLGCQIKMTDELDGLTVTLPAATRNMLLD